MADRYKQLIKTGAQYQSDCPILLAASALLLDTQTQHVFAQLKLESIICKSISAVCVVLECFDPAGSGTLCCEEYWFRDLEVKFSDQFGQKTAIAISQDAVRSFTVHINTIVFSDGDSWDAADPKQIMHTLPEKEPLNSILGTELAEQYIRECKKLIGRNSANTPQRHDSLVFCACGATYHNSERTCPKCGIELEEFEHLINEAYLEEQITKYRETQRIAAEKEIEQKRIQAEKEKENQRFAAIREAANKKLIKKRLAIALPFLAVISSLLIVIFIAIPSNKYRQAVALFEEEQFDAAAIIFENLGGFSDSSEQAHLARNSSLYAKAERFLSQEQYDEAINIFESLADFSDSSDQANLAKYTKAESLLNNREYDDAISIFSTLGNYRDASERVLEVTYEKADLLFDTEKYIEAALAFGSLNDYKDSEERKLNSYYTQADTLLKEGDTYGAALAFYQIREYKDAWKRCFDTWGELTIRDSISAGGDWTIGITQNGQLIYTGPSYIFSSDLMPELRNVATVSSTNQTVAFLMTDGTVKVAGRDFEGQLETRSWEDIVALLPTVFMTFGLKADGTVEFAGDTHVGDAILDVINWKNIVAIDGSSGLLAGLKSDGTVIVAGDSSSINVDNWSEIKAISASGNIAGLKSDGSVIVTGSNEYGQCNVSSWKNIIEVSATSSTTVGLKSDGTVVATGWNKFGQCEVSGWTNIEAIYTDDDLTIGLKSDGTVVVAGNWKDQTIYTWTGIVDISIEDDGGGTTSGPGPDHRHIVGLKTDGTAVAAGLNDEGQCDVSTWTNILFMK